MFKILTNDGIFPSAKLLRDKLANKLNIPILVTSNPDRIKTPNFIRYGNSFVNQILTNNAGINSANFISLAANKLAFSYLMQEKGIYSPIYYKEQIPVEFPVVIRKTLKSFGGKGIMVAKDKEEFDKEWNNNYYWTPFVYARFELRLHILGGELVKVFKKKREDNLAEEEFPIRNNDRGYHFQLVQNLERFPKLLEVTKQLSDILIPLGGSFFSADIGFDSIAKKYFIFEINSASGLNDNTAELYADYLAKVINQSLVVENK